MKYTLHSYKIILICLALSSISNIASAKNNMPIDYRTSQQSVDIIDMQNFHLKNAEDKLHKEQLAYAWGDLAYILCQIPNHHVALQHMLEIAPKLNKQAELQKFLANALKHFPKDDVVYALYGTYYYNNGDHTTGAKFIEQALQLNPALPSEYLPTIVQTKNNLTNQP